MTKENSKDRWIESGYNLFSREGLEFFQVERLARILGSNKSGFYHYFGDRDSYLEDMMSWHLKVANALVADMYQINQIDPDFFHVLLKHQTGIMAHMQLVRNRHHPLLARYFQKINDLVDPIVVPMIARFLNTPDNYEFAFSYYEQMRDAFYSRITFENMNEEWLRSYFNEAKEMIAKLNRQA